MTSADKPETAETQDAAPVEETGAADTPATGTDEPANAETAAAAGGDADGDKVSEDLDALLEKAVAERDEYLDMAKRARADFENFRKRASRDVAEAETRGAIALAKRLLPAIDNLERARAAADSDDESVKALAEGVGLVLQQLHEALGQAGIEMFDPTGEEFDPNLHEALSTVPGTGAEPGRVVETVTRGYRAGEVVVRAAQVVVAG